MRSWFLCVCLLLSGLKVSATPGLQWTSLPGSSGADGAMAVAAAPDGGFYVVGFVSGSFGFPWAGGRDAFMIRFSASGATVQTWQWGTAGDDSANAVALDAVGNIYVAGYTQGTLDGEPARGGLDAFLKKFNAAGVAQWTRVFGSVENDWANSVIVEPSGEIAVCGVTLGNNFDGNPGLSAGDSDGFIKWSNAAGTTPVDQDVMLSSSPGAESFQSLCLDASSNLCMLASGLFVFGHAGPSSGANVDAFVFKLAPVTHALVGQTSFGASGHDDEPRGMACDAGGRFFVVGGTQGNSFLQPSDPTQGRDLFVVILNSALTMSSQLITGSSGDDKATSVCVLGNEVFLVGFCGRGIDGQSPVSTPPSYDSFMMRYRSTMWQWTRIWGGTSTDLANGVAVAPDGGVLAVGQAFGDFQGIYTVGPADACVASWRDTDLLWVDTVPLGGDWRWSPWFGALAPAASGWIYHEYHGWMYAYGYQQSDVWFWQSGMDWMWSGFGTYPYLYRHANGNWNWYLSGTHSPRWFVDLSNGIWESHPRE